MKQFFKKFILPEIVAFSLLSRPMLAQTTVIQAPSQIEDLSENGINTENNNQEEIPSEPIYKGTAYLAGIEYLNTSYSDEHANELKGTEGKLKTTLSTLTANFGYLFESAHLYRLNLSNSSPALKEWQSKTSIEGSYSYIFEIIGFLIPQIGIRKISNDVELDQQLSPKISVLGSFDFIAGIEHSIDLLTFSRFTFISTIKYFVYNPGNKFDFGSNLLVKFGALYQTGAFKALVEIGATLEKYEAKQTFNSINKESIYVKSQSKSILFSIAGWYDPGKAAKPMIDREPVTISPRY